MSRSRGKCWCSAGSDSQRGNLAEDTLGPEREKAAGKGLSLTSKHTPATTPPSSKAASPAPQPPRSAHPVTQPGKAKSPGKLIPGAGGTEWSRPQGGKGRREARPHLHSSSISLLPGNQRTIPGVRGSKPSGLHHKDAHLGTASRFCGAYRGQPCPPEGSMCEVGLEAGTPGCWGPQQLLPSPPENHTKSS